MVSTSYHDHLKALVESGRVAADILDESVRNILRLKFRLGLFDEHNRVPAESKVTPESLELAERLAAESVVLLKNESNLLPLANSVRTVAVIGPLADSPTDQMGTWVMDGRPADVQTPLAALRQTLGNNRVLFSPGLKNSRDRSHDGFAEALKAVR